MAIKRYWTVENERDDSTFGLGTSDQARLKTLFPASPGGTADPEGYNDETARELMRSVLDGTVSDAGHTFGSVDMDWGHVDNPTLDPAVNVVGADGQEHPPYAPNIASPSEGADRPESIPDEGIEATRAAHGGGAPFRTPRTPGGGALPNPKASSQAISEQDGLTLGSLLPGKSTTS